MDKKLKKVDNLIFTTEKFPYGSPGGRRICNLLEEQILISKNSIIIILDNENINFDKFIFFESKIFKYKRFTRHNVIKFISYFYLLKRFLFYVIILFKNYEIKQTYIYSRMGFFTLLLILISKFNKTKVLIDNTEWFTIIKIPGFLNKISEFIHRFLSIRLADKYYAIGLNIRDILLRKYPKKEVQIIYPCPPQKIINTINKIKKENQYLNNLFENNEKTIFYAGSFKESDDPHFLLDVLISLSKEIGFKFIVVSQNLLKNKINSSLAKKINKLKKQLGNRRFLIYGYLNDEEFFKIIYSSNIILLPKSEYGASKFNQPMRLAEYAQFDKPILTTKIDENYKSKYSNIFSYECHESNSFKLQLKNLILNK